MLHLALGLGAEDVGVVAPWEFSQLHIGISALFHVCVVVQERGPPLSKGSFFLSSVKKYVQITARRGVGTVRASGSADVSSAAGRCAVHSTESTSSLSRDPALPSERRPPSSPLSAAPPAKRRRLPRPRPASEQRGRALSSLALSRGRRTEPSDVIPHGTP